MANNIKEFVNADGTLISSKIPNTDPKTTAKTTTDKSMTMRSQPFMFNSYRRFFGEGELPYNKEADEMKDNPEGFHKFLKSINEEDKFNSYFQKTDDVKDKLKEIAKEKAYKMMETIFSKRKLQSDVITKTPPTIEEIRNKEMLLVDKLTKLAETMKTVLSEEEKDVLLSYFNQQLKNG
jgi:hypothetical protein